jgi:DNA-binding IclR family transcriptional regulator
VVAALTISGPESRFSKENILRFAALVTHAAAELSKQLGNV